VQESTAQRNKEDRDVLGLGYGGWSVSWQEHGGRSGFGGGMKVGAPTDITKNI